MKHNKFIGILLVFLITLFQSVAFADLTEQQGQDVVLFAEKFIQKGNERRDEKGYPLLTYALTGSWGTNMKIRNAGYNEQLYLVKNIAYYKKNGVYMNLGEKWCMDCGTFVSYVMNKTLGLDMHTGEEPWHVQDMYDDACKKNSKYLYFIYKQTPISNIDYSSLKLGDIVACVTSNGNHVMIYIGDGKVVHTNGDLITKKEPYINGFTISKLEEYYSKSKKINIMRIKDGIVPEDYVVKSKIVWPDTGEEEEILDRQLSVVDEKANSEIPIFKFQYPLYVRESMMKDFWLKIFLIYIKCKMGI